MRFSCFAALSALSLLAPSEGIRVGTDFTTEEDQLAQLDAHLTAEEDQLAQLLAGMLLIDKDQLAQIMAQAYTEDDQLAQLDTLCISYLKAKLEDKKAPFNELALFQEHLKGTGYGVELHVAETKDGYKNRLFRLVKGSESPEKRSERTPVLFQHGINSNAATWIERHPSKIKSGKHMEPPAIQAMDAGFDVWLGSNRGTLESSELQRELDGKLDDSYYNYSFAEMGVYD